MKFSFIFVFMSLAFGTIAQNNQYESLADSDQNSKSILDKMKAQVEAYESLEADFSLIIEIPEEDPIVQKGVIKRQGDSYNVNVNGQEIISNGSSIWMYQAANNSVQISNFDPEADAEELFSPQNIMQFYDEGKYIVAPIMLSREDNKRVRWIELKPVDQDSEYFKFRISLDANKDEIRQVKAFSKDGARYTLQLNKITPNKKFSKDIFLFDAKAYPGVSVEDLRIN